MFHEVDAAGPELADALHAMYAGHGDALILHNAFDPAALARAVDHLSSEGARYHWDLQEKPDPTVRQMKVLGRTLTPVAGGPFDLDAYAELGRATGAVISEQLPGFFQDFEALMERLSGGRPVRVARDGNRAYGPATVRHLPVGCQIPVHCGLFFMQSDGYREIMGHLDDTTQLSWFVPMQTAEQGGELAVYDLKWGSAEVPTRGPMYDPRAIEAFPAIRVSPPVGSILLFDGGRWFHKVSPVQGARDRWTLGGFLGFDRSMQRLAYWS